METEQYAPMGAGEMQELGRKIQINQPSHLIGVIGELEGELEILAGQIVDLAAQLVPLRPPNSPGPMTSTTGEPQLAEASPVIMRLNDVVRGVRRLTVNVGALRDDLDV